MGVYLLILPQAGAFDESLLLAGHVLFRLFDQALDHVAADIAGLTGGQIAVVALLQVDAQLTGDFVLHVVQGLTGLGHHNAVAVVIVAAVESLEYFKNLLIAPIIIKKVLLCIT